MAESDLPDVDLDLTRSTEALDQARQLGIPDDLFVGLCRWFSRPGEELTTTPFIGYRFDPNTRARALHACKRLSSLRDIGVIGG